MKIKLSRPIEGEIKTATLSKTSSGKYFVSLSCQVEIQPKEKLNSKIGIDVGLKEFAICSNGQRFENAKFYRHYEKRLGFLQRKSFHDSCGFSVSVKGVEFGIVLRRHLPV